MATTTDEAPQATPKVARGARYVITAVALLTGAAGLVFEYLLATTASYLLGSSNYQFAVTIGLMMGMMGVGAWVQRAIPDRRVLGTFIGIELVLGLMGGFAAIANLMAFAKMPDHYPLVQYAFIIGIGLAIGMEIPLAARMNEQFERRLKMNLATIVGADYAGALIGAIIWVKLINLMIPLTTLGFYIAMANLAVAALCLCYFWRRGMIARRRAKLGGAVAIVLSAATLMFGTLNAGAWTVAANQDLYADPIVFSETTPYQQLVITQRTSPDDTRLYINGNLQFSSEDEAIYHELLVHPAMNLGPHGRVLILGGGDGMALREVLKYPDVTSVTLVDLDPAMIQLARTNPLLTRLNQGSFSDARVTATVSGLTDTGETTDVVQTTDDRVRQAKGTTTYGVRKVATVHVYTVDAFQFIRAHPGIWNTIFVDLPDPSTVELAKLYSQEFYGMVKGVLAPDGFMAVQSGSPYHARQAYVCILESIKAAGFSVLPYHANVPSFGDWGWTLAWKSSLPDSVIRDRIAGLQSWPVPTRYLVDGASFTSTLSFGRGWLDDRNITPSTLMNPTILNYYVQEGWKIE